MAVTSKVQDTDRLRIHYLGSGPEDGVPVLMVHGNLATGRFFEHVMDAAPDGYRLIAPDMRGFGDTEPLAIDATRGLRDWADDSHSLVEALGIEPPVHLVGWSTGGGAVANYAMDRPDQVRSVTLIDPVSPFWVRRHQGCRRHTLFRRLCRFGWRRGPPGVRGASRRQGPIRGVTSVTTQRHQQLLLVSGAPRAA